MVVDTSALLAIIFNEPKGPVIARTMQKFASSLLMSTVNLTEALILIEDRQPQLADDLATMILSSNIRFMPPTQDHARAAAKARMKFPLNLGDCFAYALAKAESCSILTLDQDFLRTDITLVELA